MIRYYASAGLQLVGLIVTMEALLIYFGDMGPMMQTAAIGAGPVLCRPLSPAQGQLDCPAITEAITADAPPTCPLAVVA